MARNGGRARCRVRWLQGRRQGLSGADARRADGRRADAQHVAERAEDGLELWGGAKQGCHFRVGQEVAELGGGGGGFGHQAQQPGAIAWQDGARQGKQRRRFWAPSGLFRFAWNDGLGVGRGRRRGQGVMGGARSEAGGHAAQPRPDQDDERAGEARAGQAAHAAQAPGVAAPGDGLAQARDDESEAVCRGGRDRNEHD
jgi:hypothetical protein